MVQTRIVENKYGAWNSGFEKVSKCLLQNLFETTKMIGGSVPETAERSESKPTSKMENDSFYSPLYVVDSPPIPILRKCRTPRIHHVCLCSCDAFFVVFDRPLICRRYSKRISDFQAKTRESNMQAVLQENHQNKLLLGWNHANEIYLVNCKLWRRVSKAYTWSQWTECQIAILDLSLWINHDSIQILKIRWLILLTQPSNDR